MKKNTFFYLLFFAILFAFPSCATDPLLRKYIVGQWNPVKIGSVDLIKIIPAGEVDVPPYSQEEYKMLTDLKQNLSKTNAEGSSQRSTEEDFNRLLSEANTSYIFRNEGFGGRLNPEQPMKGKWKLKKKGTRLILTDDRTKEQFVLIIDSLSSRKMIATNKNLPNGMKVTYIKQTDEAP
jgi:hypothetical protein